MINFSIWKILGIIAAVLLIIFRQGQNAVWGGLTIGAIISSIITIVYLLMEGKLNWSIIGKGAVLGTMVGFIAELLGIISDFIGKKKHHQQSLFQ